ncbi:MAG: hypothetical protein ACOCUJ_04100 [Thiohalospira sp.]
MKGLAVYDDDGGEIFNSETTTILSIGRKEVLGTHEDHNLAISTPEMERDLFPEDVDIVTAQIGESPPFAEITKKSRSFSYYTDDGKFQSVAYVSVDLKAMDQEYRDLFSKADSGQCVVVAVVE